MNREKFCASAFEGEITKIFDNHLLGSFLVCGVAVVVVGVISKKTRFLTKEDINLILFMRAYGNFFFLFRLSIKLALAQKKIRWQEIKGQRVQIWCKGKGIYTYFLALIEPNNKTLTHGSFAYVCFNDDERALRFVRLKYFI